MDAPYRELAALPIYRAPSRAGTVALEVGPQHVRLELGERLRLMVAGSAATWVRHTRGGERRRELSLRESRLWPARSFPTGDLAMWYERQPGQVERLGGVRSVAAFDSGALAAWSALDRVADELGHALALHSGSAVGAVELGSGHHRVLLVQLAERFIVYARPLFRERPRRALEVCSDGALVVPGRQGDRVARFPSRAHVAVSGDRICFTGGDGGLVVSLWLPWIAVEDRQEMVRRFADMVEPAPPEPDYEPRTGLRPWASGLGRRLPAGAAFSRFRR